MIFLHKIVPQLIMPISVYLVVVLLATVKGYKKLIYAVTLLFYLASTPFFSDHLFKQMEGEYQSQEISRLKKADAIVVLSGMMNIYAAEGMPMVEWSDPDRLFGGIRLYEACKAHTMVFTGGRSPFRDTPISEGQILKTYAVKLGVNAADIQITTDVLNTAEEALAVKNLLGAAQNIILVTSAFHMPRAKNIFEKQGFTVQPYTVDYKTPPSIGYGLYQWLPSGIAIKNTEQAFREWIGRIYYTVF